MTRLSSDAHGSAQTLELVSAYLTGTESRLSPVPGFKHLTLHFTCLAPGGVPHSKSSSGSGPFSAQFSSAVARSPCAPLKDSQSSPGLHFGSSRAHDRCSQENKQISADAHTEFAEKSET